MTEKTLEAKLRIAIKQRGGLAVKLWSVSFTGLPDRMILMPGGRVYFAELKSPRKKPTARQLTVHRLLRDLGFQVALIDDLETLNAFLESVRKHRCPSDLF